MKKIQGKIKNFLLAAQSTFLSRNDIALPIIMMGLTFIFMFEGNMAFADAGDASKLIEEILDMVATIIIVLGIVLAVLGIVHYAAAYSEGDGPAKNKATQQIAAGGMVILLAALIKTKKGNLASYIKPN